MFVTFVIFTLSIAAWGPGLNEGGIDAIHNQGVSQAFENAWDEREAYDSGSLKKDKLGNWGND